MEFAKHGSRLILTARRIDRLTALRERLISEYGAKVHVAQVDVRDRAQVRKIIIRTILLLSSLMPSFFWNSGQ